MIKAIKEGRGEAVLFIQGVGARGEAWRPQLGGLRDRYQVLAFDNRGMDGSPVADSELSIEGMANDALDLLDAEGIDACHVVGHSMGGLIAQQVARVAPGRVKSLSLLCTFSRGREATRMTADLFWRALRTRVGSRSMRRQAFLELILPASYLAGVNRPALAQELGRLFGRDLADQPSIVMQQLRAMGRFDDTVRLAGLAGIPTLVVSAAQDRIALPAYGRTLAAGIPGARYVELADAGHAVPISDPRLINDLLLEHFVTVDQPESSRPTLRLKVGSSPR